MDEHCKKYNLSDYYLKYFSHAFIKSKSPKVLYVHTPFCNGKCGYCNAGTKGAFSKEEFNAFYENTYQKHLDVYSEIFENVKFDQVYFGGGTPTIAAAERLKEVFDMIPGFKAIAVKCIEASPHTLSDEHIKLFSEYGFSFLSVGIQSLDPEICEMHNRKHVLRKQLLELSQKLHDNSLFYNYDLICFLNWGDLRDIPQFEDDLDFLLKECRAPSVTIHQYFQSMHTYEKTVALIRLMHRMIQKYPHYSCINSLLRDEDVIDETMYETEYRLIRENEHFTHYMWNRFNVLPDEGHDILSIGYTDTAHTISNANDVMYIASKNHLKKVKFNPLFQESYHDIRRLKGLA